MELMVSIVLIVLITLFLFGAIASSKLSNDTLLKHSNIEIQRMELFELLYRDIMEAIAIKPSDSKNKHFNIIEMQTQNSLYGIVAPHVTYYVNSKTNVLTRLESAREIILPIKYEDENFVRISELLKEVTAFNFYGRSKGNNESNNTLMENNTTVQATLEGYLIYIETPQFKKPFLFELYR